MKKHKKFKRYVSTLLVSSMLLALCACGSKGQQVTVEPMEKDEVHKVTFDILGGEDVMPISGYYGPLPSETSFDGQSLPDYFTDEIFGMISDCGVNMLHHSYTNYLTAPELVVKMLELGEKHNVGICVFDSQVCQRIKDPDFTVEEMDTRINEYSDYPAFCGVYVVDEPGTTYFHPTEDAGRDVSSYTTIFKNLKELGVFGSGNLHPIWEEKDREKYNQYIEEYVTTCEPMYLSFDYYLWDKGRSKAGYFYNVDTIRKYAEKYDIPFWCYIQAGGQWNDGGQYFDSDEYYPTEGQLHWNVNTALAYGAKGLEYFPTIQPLYFANALTTDYDFQRNGLIGAWGNKTQWWYYAKNANEQVVAVDSVLMNSVNKGVIASGELAVKDTKGLEFIMEGTSWRELKNVDGDALVGCFNYQGKTALYVVNYDTEYAQKITLNLQGSYNLSVTQEAETSKVNTNKLVLDLKAGQGALVVFE